MVRQVFWWNKRNLITSLLPAALTLIDRTPPPHTYPLASNTNPDTLILNKSRVAGKQPFWERVIHFRAEPLENWVLNQRRAQIWFIRVSRDPAIG